jgi:Tfp pilus assembly PilM family ATPase
MPRVQVQLIYEACLKLKSCTTLLQIPPVAVFNAFEFSNEKTFKNQAFVLVDIGHLSTTVIVGVKRELILVRSLEFGGASFIEALICHGAASQQEVMEHLAQEEVLTVDNARLSLTELVRSISSSIGFFEARREDAIPRVFVSGGMAHSPVILKILTEELQLPCEAWDPFAKCEINLSAERKRALADSSSLLSAACGAAAELISLP